MPHMNKQMASFFLTTRCNLRCIYCYNREERSQLKEQTLPLDIAKAGVDYYFTNSLSRNYICLFDYLFISSQMSAKPYFMGSTGILHLR